MKVKLLLLSFVFHIIVCNCSFAQEHTKDTLYVENVDFNILTFSSIPCGSFATNFKDRIKFRAISDRGTIAMLDSFLNKVRYARKDRDVDVRAKFIYEKENKNKITICTNGNEVLVEGRLIRHNSKFVDFLRGLTR